MLTQVRGALKGAVAWFVIVLLILAFALWGVPELRQLSGNAAVTVGGQSYSPRYVQNEFNRALRIQQAESGGAYTRDDAIAAGLPQEIVSSIITVAALEQFSEKMRLLTPRQLVADYLQSNESFKNPVTGKFDRSALMNILQQINVSPEEFEKRIAGELQRQQLIESLALQASAPRLMTDYALMRETERRKISYLVVTDDMAGKPAEPTPDDLRAYYEAHQDAFTAPEYRTMDVVLLKSEDFREGVDVSEDELRRIYDQNRERLYEKPERRTLYQITYSAEAEAQAAAAALGQGKTFEALAEDRGRSLEDVTFADAQKSDILDPGVAEAAFADGLEEGAVVGPVEGLFGWTVAQVAGVTPPQIIPFEEAREEIEDAYYEQDARRALLDALDEIEEERDTGASLAAAAEAVGLEVKSYGPVDRVSFAPGGAIVDGLPGEVLAEAFVLEEDQQSEAMRLSDDDGYFFVSVSEIRPPALLPFEEVRDDVETRWRRRERAERIAATVADIRKRLEGGESLAAVADEFGRAPTTAVLNRAFENEAISRALTDEIFSVAEGGVASGDAAIGVGQTIAVVDVVAVSGAAAPPDQMQLYGRYLGYQLDQELVDAFLAAVRNDYAVKINEAQIEALFSDAR